MIICFAQVYLLLGGPWVRFSAYGTLDQSGFPRVPEAFSPLLNSYLRPGRGRGALMAPVCQFHDGFRFLFLFWGEGIYSSNGSFPHSRHIDFFFEAFGKVGIV